MSWMFRSPNSKPVASDADIPSIPHTAPRLNTRGATAASPAFSRPSTSTSSGSRPIRLVYKDEKGLFRMDPEAVAVLRRFKGPLGVVAVCGRARQGKSFILNQLLGRTSGFTVGPTHKPCTKGLWIWSSPVPCKAPDGSTYHLLLLDSEGIEAYDQTATYSTQIFSLAVLLSSLFVFNQLGGIDESSIDRLSMVTEMTKHVKVRAEQPAEGASGSSGTVSTMNELGRFSPVFFWLLRDFYFDLTEDGRVISPRDYLEEALRPFPGSNPALKAKNTIRTSIRDLFPERDCFALVRPVHEEKQLQRLDQQPMDALRPEFRQGLELFTAAVMERAKPKAVGDTIMTGPILAALTQAYIDSLNGGSVPTILTSWQSVEESECRRALDAALQEYNRVFGSPDASFDGSLEDLRHSALKSALAVLNEEAVGGGVTRLAYEERLRSETGKLFAEVSARLKAEAERNCQQLLQGLGDRLRVAGRATPRPTVGEMNKIVTSVVQEFEARASGPSKWRALSQFVRSSIIPAIADVAESHLKDARQQLLDAQRDATSSAERHARLATDVAREKAAADEASRKVAAVESELADAKRQLAMAQAIRDQLQASVGEGARKQSELTRELEREREEVKRVRGQVDGEMKRERERVEELKRECGELKREIEEERRRSGKWQALHQSVVSEGKREVEKGERERERAVKEMEEERKRREEEYINEAERKNLLIADLQEKLSQLLDDTSKAADQAKDAAVRLATTERMLVEAKGEIARKEEEMRALKDAAGSSSAAMQSARKAKADAEAAAVARENHIRQLTNERDAAELARRQATETARQAKDQAESSQKELKRLADLLKEVTAAGERERQRAEEASQKATDSQGLVEVLRGDLQAKERAWQADHSVLLGEIEAKKGEIAVLSKEVEMSKGDARGMDLAGEKLWQQAEQARQQLSKADAELAGLRAEVSARGAAEEGLLRERDEAVARLTALKSENAALLARLGEGGSAGVREVREGEGEAEEGGRRRKRARGSSKDDVMEVDVAEGRRGGGPGDEEGGGAVGAAGVGVGEGGRDAAAVSEDEREGGEESFKEPGDSFMSAMSVGGEGGEEEGESSRPKATRGKGRAVKSSKGKGRAGSSARGKGKATEDENLEENEETKRLRKEAEKMTIVQLKNAITEAGGGAIVLELRNGPKAKLVEAYMSVTKE